MKRWLAMALLLLVCAPARARIPAGDLLAGVKPGADGMIDVLTVFAHPDDESFYLAGTLLKMKSDPRVRLHIFCLTNGDKDRAGRSLGISEAELARIRVAELASAGAVLGAVSVIDQGYPDQGLAGADQDRLQREILDRIQGAGAEVVITHDPLGITAHPDHVTCSRATLAAFNRSAAQRLYYVTMARTRYRLNRMVSTFQAPAQPAYATFKVYIRPEKKMKKLALSAHASQRNFSMFNALAMKEDLLYDYEYFTLGAENKP
jgi:LmbE family N-acetylglucosaminyl deacetylase